MKRALVVALAAALAVACPVELFLVCFVVLGPLHYFTELTWLRNRRCFVEARGGIAALLVLALVGGGAAVLVENASLPVAIRGELQRVAVIAMFTAVLLSALVALARNAGPPAILLVLVCSIATGAALDGSSHAREFFLVFGLWLPTLVHVYAFTALFLLHGWLTRRGVDDRAALLSFAVASIAVYAAPFPTVTANAGLGERYAESFGFLNRAVLDALAGDATIAEDALGSSGTRLSVMRFIAFAYGYHFVNWFEKSTRTGWYRVPLRQLVTIGTMWLLAIALGVYDLRLAVGVLLVPNVLHLVLELPLDWRTARDVARELGHRLLLIGHIRERDVGATRLGATSRV